MERLARFSLSSSTLAPIPVEAANAWTHGIGWGLSVIGAAALMRTVLSQGDAFQAAGCAIYTGSLVALYATSTLSHAFDHPARKHLFRMLDQVCIFLLIAGSYTPFVLSHVRTAMGWTLLAAVWLLATIGIIVRVRSGPKPVAFYWYVALALMPVIILGHVAAITGMTGLSYVLMGGMAYMLGLWFFVNDHKHPYYHAIWHCCVIVGSGLHFAFHYQFVAI